MADPSSEPEPLLRIGQLAARAGVSVETLRYYERLGLLSPASRSHGGHRIYDLRSVHAITVVRKLQRLGFSLHTIAELLGAAAPRAHDRDHRTDKSHLDDTAALLENITQKMEDLSAIHSALVSGVPILHVLTSED